MTRAAKGGPRGGVPREQTESRFSLILGELVARIPGARAAALVDRQGETVDYAGQMDGFAVRVAAAHLRLVLEDAGAAGSRTSLAVRTTRGGFAIYSLPDGYAIAVLLSHRARLTGHARAISAVAHLLADEVGWTTRFAPEWHAVEVIADSLGRPQGIRGRGAFQPLDAMGRYESGLGWRQRAWRVRFTGGVEAMLVREPGGFWYADEAPETPSTKKSD
jgi:hypothetical protein